jgi:malate synthase
MLETDLEARGITLNAPLAERFDEILTLEALSFVADLARKFEGRRRERLDARVQRQERLDAGEFPDFLKETAEVRASEWRVAPVPEDLQDRRVEITGPPERKMVINALNSGAHVYMCDFEDSHAPTWNGTIEGQINLKDAIRRQVDFTAPNGKSYKLADKTATLMVRPRGWHLDERHVLVDGKPVSGGIFDFGLFFFHNAAELMKRKTGPYFYLPKMENHLEARLWNDIFVDAQAALGIPKGSIKATVLIETIMAAFEMDEILYELRDHSAGLNCGRWDYIFSFIKRFRKHPEFVLPDRAQVTMTSHFMRSYSRLLIKTCHRRAAHAMGGMAAQIPIKNDAEANATAIAKVRDDKLREVQDGHDGTWVAHPGLVQVAMDIFNEHMKSANQVDRVPDYEVSRDDLLKVQEGKITEDGLRTNINVGLLYLESWLRGSGCVPLYNLMEDAATAEISRTQIWQWVRYPGGKLEDGRNVDMALFRATLDEEMNRIREMVGDEQFRNGRFKLAAELFDKLIERDELEEFLTLEAYNHLN